MEYESRIATMKAHYESRLEEMRMHYERQLSDQKHLVKIYREQIFEMAKRPTIANTTANTTTTTQMNQRTMNVINQLAPYDLDSQSVKHLVNQHFTTDVFFGGPDEIAKFTAQVILKDPDTNKTKLICTDLSRKNFRYLPCATVTQSYEDPGQQTLHVDPGFQKTHQLIREPLVRANIQVYTDVLKVNEEHRDQWKANDEFISDRGSFSDKLVQFLTP
jgi:hypothetical protein